MGADKKLEYFLKDVLSYVQDKNYNNFKAYCIKLGYKETEIESLIKRLWNTETL